MLWLADGASAADWVAAIGQALGALGTAAGVYAALRVAARERAEDRAAHARRVSVRAYNADTRRIVVDNRGDASIIDVELVRADGEPFRPDATRTDGALAWEVIAPQSKRDAAVPSDVEPTVTFTDGAGRRWRRRGTSPPEPAPDSSR